LVGKNGHKNIVEALLKRYADVNVRAKDGKTCLHWAIDKNHASIVKTLLDANPDLVSTIPLAVNHKKDAILCITFNCRNPERQRVIPHCYVQFVNVTDL
jgi:ankyrin repeat protein